LNLNRFAFFHLTAGLFGAMAGDETSHALKRPLPYQKR